MINLLSRDGKKKKREEKRKSNGVVGDIVQRGRNFFSLFLDRFASLRRRTRERSERREPLLESATLLPDASVVDVNLLHEDGEAPGKTMRIVSFHLALTAFVSLVCLALVFGLFSFAVLRREQHVRSLRGQQEQLRADLKRLEGQAREVSELERRLASVRQLLNRHVLWTRFFSLLERYTLPSVYYTTLRVGVGEKITMMGMANSVESVAKQLLVFEKAEDFIRSVTISSVQAAGESERSSEASSFVRFTLDLDLNPAIFYFTP